MGKYIKTINKIESLEDEIIAIESERESYLAKIYTLETKKRKLKRLLKFYQKELENTPQDEG